MKIEELRIPAPWGHIAAKSWGNAHDPAVIAVHGTGDNASSFDALIPLLPKHFYYICIDLPGHGHSTPFPSGIPLYFEYLLYPVKLVMEHFKKDSYILMGHGLGAALCTLVSQIYHDFVTKLILIDATTSWPEHPTRFGRHMKESIENAIKASRNDEKTLYSFKQANDILKNSKKEGKLTPKASEVLLQRMLKKVDEDKYLFTSDDRLSRITYPSFHFEDLKRFLEFMPVRGEVVFINFTETTSWYSDYKEKSWSLLPAVKHSIKGHHYYHLTNPETISDIISKFLLIEKSKL